MIRTTGDTFMQPPKHTVSTTEVMLEAFNAIPFVFRCLATIVTGDNYTFRSCKVSTSSRTEFLLRMIAGRLKQVLAMGTRFRKMLTTRFVSTSNRAETDNSICAFSNWLATVFTELNHDLIIV